MLMLLLFTIIVLIKKAMKNVKNWIKSWFMFFYNETIDKKNIL